MNSNIVLNTSTRKIFLILAAFAFMVSSSLAQRTMKTINDGWDFRKDGETHWQSVNLPHTFNLDAYFKRNYYQGKGVYRKILSLPNIDSSKRYYLKIDAASKAADVKVNGQEIGHHTGGYSAFTFDITHVIKEKNEIEITVDNARKDITPLWADFTFWGGIYRDVWLITTPEQHFNMTNYGSSGVFVNTPVVNNRKGQVHIKAEITNDAISTTRLHIKNQFFDAQGKLIQTKTQPLSLNKGETRTIECISSDILHPQLWTPESPTLYKVTTSIINPKNGQILDEVSNKIGFRWFSFDADKGFSLNGKPYKLRGVNRHQDQAPIGVAIDDEVNRRDIQQIKDIGCNFIRISHYPQDDALLDACDELGLLAWEEIPIVNLVPDDEVYNQNCETNLVEMVRQHYNHPSIIAWGYMNEILLIAPTPDKPEWDAVKERTVKLAQQLEKRLKEEDPSRASVMAFHGSDLYNTIGLALSDVAGWNLYQGWYFGELSQFEEWLEDQHTRYPHRPIIVSEWGAGSDKRIHSSQSHAFDFSMEYQQKYIEHYLPYIEKSDYIAGCAYWNYIDFNVAARQESMPRVNNKGLFYNDRTPKDVAYYFKAMWRTDIPVLHIASRDHASRVAKNGEIQTIKIYTNLNEVELILNGKSCGKQHPTNYNTIFHVSLPQGRSTLIARGYRNDSLVEDAMMITYRTLPDLSRGEELAINVGSNCYFTSDVSQLTWLPDQPYTHGSWGYVNGQSRSTTSEIHNTIDGPIYQTWLENVTEYKIDAPKGIYEVELLIADVTRPSKQQANLLGRADEQTDSSSNRFNVSICANLVEPNFSPGENNRYLNACRRRFIVQNNDNCINIHFTPLQGKPILSGIKIRKL
ncbi:glycoside hydrolase family 2 TIM barrel-domain containing protein [uncultured Bacteroides sp.]|uniref:glycoside hydrolase family 2 TIM barrel-domain containing protein n=1 Tax=uncultured Bacteroides sp. TaxID=162156 RepID=UPI00280B33CB|nr:glycoside hydrolase family 2 TIM barrel-domain containing protein [uncultured Bacteroides sp.]